jgi:hypothetical protein
MSRSLTLLLTVLFILSLLASSYHSHPEPTDRSTCIYCKLANDMASACPTVHAGPTSPDQIAGEFTREFRNIICFSPSLPTVSRASPA